MLNESLATCYVQTQNIFNPRACIDTNSTSPIAYLYSEICMMLNENYFITNTSGYLSNYFITTFRTMLTKWHFTPELEGL